LEAWRRSQPVDSMISGMSRTTTYLMQHRQSGIRPVIHTGKRCSSAAAALAAAGVWCGGSAATLIHTNSSCEPNASSMASPANTLAGRLPLQAPKHFMVVKVLCNLHFTLACSSTSSTDCFAHWTVHSLLQACKALGRHPGVAGEHGTGLPFSQHHHRHHHCSRQCHCRCALTAAGTVTATSHCRCLCTTSTA
jgi:hypothetical protein